ncbi:MAG: hypothetical protein GY705_27830 [Bacteroidetes bacterium]|nr:hypothetical protein [Bacteroidota bacterium]
MSSKWKEVTQKEKDFLKCKGSKKEKDAKRECYRSALRIFDRSYRKAKRNFFKKQGEEIEQLQTNDPQTFWQKIKELGPEKTKRNIPMEVIKKMGPHTMM